jgi:hypothetical protein
MIRTKSLYETCHELFLEYPRAAEAIDESNLIRSMVLLLPEGDDARFFVLVADCTTGTASFSMFRWRADRSVDIEPSSAAVPDALARALTRGVPIPREGSLFGWIQENAVTALIGVQTQYAPASPVPSWAVMPLASIHVARWPPFAGDRLFGPWFWEYCRAGTIVPLDDLIARTADLVFWVDSKDVLGSDCCAVAQDVQGAAGYILRQGCYVNCVALRSGKSVPSLAQLLASTDKTDLGPRFRLPAPHIDAPLDEGCAGQRGILGSESALASGH